MGTNRKRTQRSRVNVNSGFTEVDFLFFTFGAFFEAEGYADGKSDQQLLLFWRKHEKAMLARYMTECRSRNHACQRPTSWWAASMPEPQRKIEPGEFDAQQNWDHQRRCFDWVESDAEYLKRLNLLEDWEIKMLEKGGKNGQ